MNQIISQEALLAQINEWITRGARVIGPTRIKPDLIHYATLDSPEQILLDGFLRPANSVKDFLFPRHEELCTYRFKGKQIELCDGEPCGTEQLIIGARPCDATALPILDHVFNWDYQDHYYNHRRETTTIVTIACKEHDEHCFCTSVGLGPDAPNGSDAMLIELDDGGFEVRCVTEKGHALFADKTKPSDKSGTVPPGPAKKIDPQTIEDFVKNNFESPLWQEHTLRCLGCGICAYTCPTCHCFDIVDEGNAAGGVRVRNWDACQCTMFTAHASGHNPRTTQPQRQRQRICHKFHIYPQKFGQILCTGCGNCARNCPAGLGVLSVLEAIGHAAEGDTSEAAHAEHL